jgi:hypothetical protein
MQRGKGTVRDDIRTRMDAYLPCGTSTENGGMRCRTIKAPGAAFRLRGIVELSLVVQRIG